MSAPIQIPFNFEPKALNIGSSYTIPAGEYGFVTVQVNPSGTFTINGSTAINNPADSTFQNVSENGSSGTIYTVPSGRIFEGQVAGPSKDIVVGTVVFPAGNAYPVKIGPGGTVAAAVSGSGFVSVSGYTRPAERANPPLIATFYVKAGDVLSGSGTRIITAQRFNSLS